MKIPKKTKYRKYYKINIEKIEIKKTKLNYGQFGIKAQTNGYLRLGQMERIKLDIMKKLKHKSNIFFNFNPIFGLTEKGAARMGSGKGDICDWYMPVKKGRILIEFSQCKVPKEEIKKIIKYSAVKWPILISFTEVKQNFYEKLKW
uniref:Ribosomal protein L16 n=1 Tax=Heterostelium pallidum TaxID=13642 RepID=Q5ILK8_HETPA|nr:ribosomal protein L16 [Heterostelium pallidum]AAU00602.1 ribosomal protein L16 [Heterostelium pallidum]